MSQTQNAFFLNYCQSKNSWGINDEHWQELLNSPKPPVTAVRKAKIKSIVRPMTREEIKVAFRQYKKIKPAVQAI